MNKVLRRLVEQGVVDTQEAGNARLYSLNRDHVAASAVDALADLRSLLLQRLRETIRNWDVPPVHASVYGPAARGDGGPSSEVDLFVIRPDLVGEGEPTWRGQLARLADDVRRWTGNRAEVAEVPEYDLTRLRRDRPHVVQELEADAVTLSGASASTLLAETPR